MSAFKFVIDFYRTLKLYENNLYKNKNIITSLIYPFIRNCLPLQIYVGSYATVWQNRWLKYF